MVPSHKDLGVLVDLPLGFHLHIRSVIAKASGLASNFLKSTVSRSRTFMLTILKSHLRPIIEFASPVWATYFIEDLRALEAVQRRWTKEIEGLSDTPYHARLRELDLYSVKGRLLRSDMILCWNIFNGHSSISPNDLFIVDTRPGHRGHRFKIQHRFAYTEARKRFFSVRCASVRGVGIKE